MNQKEKSRIDVFKLLDRDDVKTQKEKNKKKFWLSLCSSLFENGHAAEMGQATLTYQVLGYKSTSILELKGKLVGLVYGGKWSKTIINELAKLHGVSKKTIWRYLKRLKALGRIDYQKRRGIQGARIVVFFIPGALERKAYLGQKFHHLGQKFHHLGQNVLPLGQNVLSKNPPPEELPKENKENLKSDQKSSSPYKDSIKDHTNNNVLAAVCEILPAASKEEIQKQIQGKNPEKVIAWARACAERSNVQNPPGLFFSELKRRPELFMIDNNESTRKKLPYIYSIIPNPVIEIFRKKGLKGQGFENALWEVSKRYKDQVCHLSINFDVPKEKISQGETARMVAIAKELVK